MSLIIEIAGGLVFALAFVNISITIWNLFNFKKATSRKPTTNRLVSVLVPCRNEEETIRDCLDAILSQSYSNLQIVVIDDQSTDDTLSILSEYAEREQRVEVMKNEILPEGWIGKNWACYQLSLHAKGDILLFTDADTTLIESAIREGVASIEYDSASFVTLLPEKRSYIFADKIFWQLIGWSLLSWFPLWGIKNIKNAISVGFGQYLMFTKDAYLACGGHKAIHDKVLEDFELARSVKAAGLAARIYDGSGRVITRGYSSMKSVQDGYGKAIFAFFRYKSWLFSLVPVFVVMMAIFPISVVISAAIFAMYNWLFWLMLASMLFFMSSWVISSLRLGTNVLFALLYPLILLFILWVSLYSFVSAHRGSILWKGRRIGKKA